jgi:hypothetical protein
MSNLGFRVVRDEISPSLARLADEEEEEEEEG